MVFPIARHLAGLIYKLVVKETKGIENIPDKGPFIFASNHINHLDPLLIYYIVVKSFDKKVHFLAVRDASKNRVWSLGKIITEDWAACIPLDRADKGKSALETALKELKKGEIICIYPGSNPKKPGTGAVRLAIQSKAPIIPININNASQILPKHKFIPKKIKKIVKINIGKPIHYKEEWEKINKAILRNHTNALMKEISSLK